MTRPVSTRKPAPALPAFRVDTFVASVGLAKSATHYDRGETVFAPGDACDHLVVQLLDSSERRLTRALLILAGCGTREIPAPVVARPSPTALAATGGTTPARVPFLLRKFAGLGFVGRTARGPLTIDRSLLSLVLGD